MNIEAAREVLAMGKQWGKLFEHNLTTDQIVKAFQIYEDALTSKDAAHAEEIAQLREGYQKEISKLHGKIGGLQKGANKAQTN